MVRTIRMNEENFSKFVKKILKEVKEKLYYPKYEVINEVKSYGGAFKVNRLGDIVSKQEKCMMFEGVDWDVEDNLKGGIIVFSTDVNAINLSPNKIVNFVKQKIETIKNRLSKTKKIDKIANENELVGWTIGKYLEGRYKAKNGKNFGENSLSLELIGIDEEKLISIAEEVCKVFNQECVLVKSYSTGRIMFVNPEN